LPHLGLDPDVFTTVKFAASAFAARPPIGRLGPLDEPLAGRRRIARPTKSKIAT
jgi:hypothetical protein